MPPEQLVFGRAVGTLAQSDVRMSTNCADHPGLLTRRGLEIGFHLPRMRHRTQRLIDIPALSVQSVATGKLCQTRNLIQNGNNYTILLVYPKYPMLCWGAAGRVSGQCEATDIQLSVSDQVKPSFWSDVLSFPQWDFRFMHGGRSSWFFKFWINSIRGGVERTCDMF